MEHNTTLTEVEDREEDSDRITPKQLHALGE